MKPRNDRHGRARYGWRRGLSSVPGGLPRRRSRMRGRGRDGVGRRASRRGPAADMVRTA